jgi:hypothetical protein
MMAMRMIRIRLLTIPTVVVTTKTEILRTKANLNLNKMIMDMVDIRKDTLMLDLIGHRITLIILRKYKRVKKISDGMKSRKQNTPHSSKPHKTNKTMVM